MTAKLVAFLLLSSVVTGCLSFAEASDAAVRTDASDGGPEDGSGEGGVGSCTLADKFCPTGCMAVYGRPFDRGRRCFGEDELIMCVPAPDAMTAPSCSLRISTGTPYRFSREAPLGGDWTICSKEDEPKVAVVDPLTCPKG